MFRPLQGVNAYDNDLDIMRAPHPAHDPRVLFCGEHLSKAYFQCVDGAFDTGMLQGTSSLIIVFVVPVALRIKSIGGLWGRLVKNLH